MFSTFACGGGSSMGYKLAGFDVVGNCEIDPRIAEVYAANLHPRLSYVEDIRDFALRGEYPDELMSLDVLDGSPPCSTFSTSGNREADWGRVKRFAEGQAEQRLDDLFLSFLDVVGRLRPKCFVAENVTGLLKGNAKGYVSEIVSKARGLGYTVQVFRLNAATMGVPQLRERVFFIGNRMGWPKLRLEFSEPPIAFGEVREDHGDEIGPPSIRDLAENWWRAGEADLAPAFSRKVRDPRRRAFFNTKVLPDERPAYTVSASVQAARHVRAFDRKWATVEDMRRVQTFPQDYDFGGVSPMFVLGMSVPPVMMANVAHEIREQWLS